MEAEPDGALVRVIANGAGDRAAAEALLCRRFAPRIRLYGLRHLRDEEHARDLVQSVLLSVLLQVRAGRVDDPDKIDRYVLGTCRHNAQRVRSREARLQPTDDATLAAALAEGVQAAALHAEAERPELAALVRCVDALELRAKKIVMLSFQAERSADEIAAELAITAGNVRVARHRAIAALRRCLDTSAEESA